MPSERLDTAAIARCLSQVAERPGDLADAYFERLEEVELPGEDEAPGFRVRREEGLAVRLCRGGRSWLVSRDGVDRERLTDALRGVARVLPRSLRLPADLRLPPAGPCDGAPEVLEFPAAVRREIRRRHAAFPLRLRVRRHRRWLQVVGTRLVAEPEEESFYDVAADLPWGGYGTLLATLDAAAAERVARDLVARFRCRGASPPPPGRRLVLLGPAAAAVLVHEAVAHALETDTLALTGDPEAAVGLEMGPAELSVLDDPGSGPPGVRRRSDDEGMPVVRRWLLRSGIVEQPLADGRAAAGSRVLTPGAARRSHRHRPPAPRSTHLEVVPGRYARDELRAESDGGLLLAEVSRGRLDPLTGRFALSAPYARRLARGEAKERLGPCRIEGRVTDLLVALTGIGAELSPAGAGWCAKGGLRLPVWAKTPALRLEGVEVGG